MRSGNAPIYSTAFGNIVEAKEQIPNRFRYAGEQYDPITGQYYLRARFYNPVVGRFTQEDTYRGDGLNLYSYVQNNPVNYYDPSGYSGVCSRKSNPWNEFQKANKGKFASSKEAAEAYKNSPSTIARSWQGTHPYIGIDSYKDIILRKGKIIYAGDPFPTGYATTESALRRTGNDASKIFRGLQVGPWKAPKEISHLSGYRQTMMPYEVVEDIPAAFGITKANPHFGEGGLPQIFVLEFNKLVESGKLRPIPNKKIQLVNWHVPPAEIDEIYNAIPKI